MIVDNVVVVILAIFGHRNILLNHWLRWQIVRQLLDRCR